VRKLTGNRLCNDCGAHIITSTSGRVKIRASRYTLPFSFTSMKLASLVAVHSGLPGIATDVWAVYGGPRRQTLSSCAGARCCCARCALLCSRARWIPSNGPFSGLAATVMTADQTGQTRSHKH